MKIGELAKRAGVKASTVRFYEKRGLLALPPRLKGGYRSYGPDDLKRLTQIRQGQTLGFSLEQIGRYFSLPEKERRGKTAAVEAAKSKLKELDLHLAEVTAQKRELLAFLAKHKAD